jgi:hypothetical protein
VLDIASNIAHLATPATDGSSGFTAINAHSSPTNGSIEPLAAGCSRRLALRFLASGKQVKALSPRSMALFTRLKLD